MWAPADPPGPTGWDRRRVGARLHAALAGLQELRGLHARQRALVQGALAMHTPPTPTAHLAPRARQLRLEAALAALQEQLNQLRRQDIGLKTQLDQLGQQISALQLDVPRTPAEGPDSDSRPSSGFYELSDGGSCSPSASCASVCSDPLSSSLGTSLPAAPKARTGHGTGGCRPWSADESTMGGAPLPVWGLQATEQGAGQPPLGASRPRPVSTGDLERVRPAKAEFPKAPAEAAPRPLLCHGMGLPPHTLDPKYQHNLVSRGGREVYLYPSPLHAVALQSPLFALTKETPHSHSHCHLPPLNKTPPSPSGPSSIQAGPTLEAGPAQAYIDKLLALQGQGSPSKGRVGEQGPSRGEVSPSHRAESGSCPGGLTCSPRRADLGGGPQRRETGRVDLEQQRPAPLVGPPHPGNLSEDRQCSSSCLHVGTLPGSPRLEGVCPSLCSQGQKATLEDWGHEARLLTEAPRPCVHPHPVGSSATLIGLKVGHPRTKAVKMGRGTSNKTLRSGRQPPPWGAPAAPLRPPAWGAGFRGQPSQAREAPGRSCSESSLYPVSFFVPLLVAGQDGLGASTQALFPLEAAPPAPEALGGEAGRRQQRRWRSSMEISSGARRGGTQGSGMGPPRSATRRGSGQRPGPVCARARPRLLHRDPQARSKSGGSEPSAERASLFHSTITETSENEASDHTTNCFGDRESSASDLEDGVRNTGSHPACPGMAPPQALTCSLPSLPTAPKLCRVKASRALKKKIRRFQPAALKVMTLV